MSRKIVIEIVTFLIILLFVYAAVSKLFDYQKFTVQLGQSPMLTTYSSVLGWMVPLLELVISVLLIFPRTRLGGLYSFFGLMTMFTVYIILASRFSDYVPCSCGGVIQNLSWSQHLVFNLVFMVLGILGIFLYPKHKEGKNVLA
jgi:uncharacterized membrane protein YphA (DoxX/SURF4 family)